MERTRCEAVSVSTMCCEHIGRRYLLHSHGVSVTTTGRKCWGAGPRARALREAYGRGFAHGWQTGANGDSLDTL